MLEGQIQKDCELEAAYGDPVSKTAKNFIKNTHVIKHVEYFNELSR
jgi:hypothetical protein